MITRQFLRAAVSTYCRLDNTEYADGIVPVIALDVTCSVLPRDETGTTTRSARSTG